MAKIPLKEITFPGLDNTYTIPEIDNTLSTAGKAADAKKTGDEIESLNSELTDKADTVDMLKAFPTDTASGSVASFADGANVPVKSLIVNIDPVQDLHGQDAPYPAGGGKNLLPSIDATFTDSGVTWTLNSDGSVKLSGTATASSVYDFGRNVVTLPAGSYTTFDESISGVYAVTVFKVVSGTATAIKNGGGAFTLAEATSVFVRYIVASGTAVNTTIYPQLEAGSTATAYAPYENICPISGWSEVNVQRTGKNLFDGEWLKGYWDAVNGEFVASNIWRSSKKIACRPSTEYIVSGLSSSNGGYTGLSLFWEANGSYIGYRNTVQPFTTYDNAAYMAFYTNADTTTNVCQLEEGSIATAHEAPQIQSINIALGQTVYGGKLDVTSGVLTVDRAMVDLGTWGWGYLTSGSGLAPYFFANIGSVGIKYEGDFGNVTYNLICSEYRTTNRNVSVFTDGATCADGEIVNRSVTQIQIKDSRYTDATTFKAAMSGVMLCYELATPITVQLTPNEVTALLGSNNIWADSGNSEVVYRADPTLYIGRLTEPDADMIADTNIVSGQYFMVGNTLYKATANIASGATISPNVNCVRKSLSEALNELNV